MLPGSSLLGRSEVTRTPGILLPKQARYQLRYTPKLYYFFAHLPCSPGLRFPKKSSRCSPARFFRPRRVLRLAASAAGGARLRTPKCRRYQLRYTPIYLVLCLFFRLPACFARPACGPRKNPRAVRLLDFFDRGACSASLHPPPAALGFAPQSAGAANCATPRYYSFLLFARLPCSPGLRSTITPTVYWIFRRKSTGPPPKEKGETSCEDSPFGKCFAVLPAGITWHPLPPCGR